MNGVATPLIEWSAAARSRFGDSESVDAYTVTTVPHGVLLAVAEGFGHGTDAAHTAHAALDVVGASAFAPLPLILHDCHEALHDTRGAALSLALFDRRRPVLWWLGVGNVAGYIGHAGAGGNDYEPLVVRDGVVGQSIPALLATSVPLAIGDTLIIVTDGVHWHPGDGPVHPESPVAMARRLLKAHASTGGDAAAIVARYLGPRDPRS